MGLAVDIPGGTFLHGSGYRPLLPSSPPRKRRSARCEMGLPAGTHRQAGDLPHLSAFFCYPPPGGWVRHPDDPGTTRSQGRLHDHDLHPCPEPGRPIRPEPGRCTLNGRSNPRSLSLAGIFRTPHSLSRSPLTRPFSPNAMIQKLFPHLAYRTNNNRTPHLPQHFLGFIMQSNSR